MNDSIAALDSEFDRLVTTGLADPRVTSDVIRHLSGKKLHVYGALGRSAMLLIRRLDELGVRIAGGFDRKIQHGSDTSVGFEVLPSASVASLASDDLLILASGSAQLFQSMAAEVAILCNGAPPQLLDGRKLTYVLQNVHCGKLAEHGKYEDLLTCVSYHTKPFKCDFFRRATERLASEDVPQTIKSTGSTFNSVGYLVSEWCNLRCAQCCEAVPYLDSKEMVPADEIVADLRKLTESIKFLHRLDIVGGEPFAHKDIVNVIRKIKQLPGIGYIAVFTNGTLLPSDELCQVLVSPRIIVTNSDYSQSLTSEKKQKIENTNEKLRRFGVKVIQISDRYWFDLIKFKQNDLPDADLMRNYADCFLESCRRLYRGTLYHCAFQANGVKLGLIPKNNTVELYAGDARQVREQLDIFEHEKMIDSCRYCALPVGAKEVVAAAQLPGRTIPIIER